MLVILVIPLLLQLLPSAIIIVPFVLRAIARIDRNSSVKVIISTAVAIAFKYHVNCCLVDYSN